LRPIAEPIQGGFALRAEEGEWIAFAAGVDRKILKTNADGSSSALYRLAPGGVLDIHEHDLEEECYVAEGEIEVAGATFRAGDDIFVRRDGAHGVVLPAPAPSCSSAEPVGRPRGDAPMIGGASPLGMGCIARFRGSRWATPRRATGHRRGRPHGVAPTRIRAMDPMPSGEDALS
jgi:ChrR Cupin-like domain